MKASTPEAFQLMMEGSAALAEMEANGMRVDVEYLNRAIDKTAETIRRIEDDLRDDEVFQIWRKVYGAKADLGSREQLGHVVFTELGVECKTRTKTGLPKTDGKALEDVDFPFVKWWVDLKKLEKARDTYLIGLRNETVDGFVHPFFNLHLAYTYRSSVDRPSLQNQPIRDPRQAKIIRTSYIPRSPDHVLLEKDYSALEFRGAANFWKDRDMVQYASDPSLDIHRDMAAECYLLDLDNVSKDCRGFAKNQFVFPTLYGSSPKNCASNLWVQIGRSGLKTKAGVGVYDHLASRGIASAEQFKNHIFEVSKKFKARFPHWDKEKDVWWDLYQKRGWFELSTGFVCKGNFSYNNLMNTPIQGPSFHCLLWSIIEIGKWLKKYKMKTKLICEIHDSILADVYRPELQDYHEVSTRIMTEDIRKAWPWILTPLAVETDIAETNWYEKKPLLAA